MLNMMVIASCLAPWKLKDQIASFLSLHHLHRSIGAVESWLLCCKDLAREATIGTYMASAYGLYFFFGKKRHTTKGKVQDRKWIMYAATSF